MVRSVCKDRPLQSVINNVIVEYYNESQLLLHKMILAWKSIIGPALYDKCAPYKIQLFHHKKRGGVIFLQVSNPGFIPEIENRYHIIVDRIALFFGYQVVSKVKIIISKDS